MIVQWDGRDYELEINDITSKQARYIKDHTGFAPGDLTKLSTLDGDLITALYWLMMRQNGNAMDFQRIDIPILKFATALADASEAEDAEKKEAEEAAPKD